MNNLRHLIGGDINNKKELISLINDLFHSIRSILTNVAPCADK